MHATLVFPFTPVTWTAVADSSFGLSNINAINYNQSLDQYVVVGNNGKIATSTDTQNWTQRNSGFGESSVFCVAYGNNQYVAGGSSGRISTSTDGITWTSRSSGFGATPILAVTYSPSASLWIALMELHGLKELLVSVQVVFLQLLLQLVESFLQLAKLVNLQVLIMELFGLKHSLSAHSVHLQ